MKKTLFLATILLAIALPLAAQQHQMKAEGAADHDCAAMMAQQHAAMAKFDDMDASLQKLIDQMNAANGQAKVDAMAAVINELVTQRKALRTQMESMMPMMMEHMGHHMMEGADSMKDCPMMKGGAKSSESMEDCPMMKGKSAKPANKSK